MSSTSIHIGHKRYKLLELLGSGGFSEVFNGVDTVHGNEVAIKLEKADCKYPQLLYEAKIYRMLSDKQCVPEILYAGREGGYNALVMSKLGCSLEDQYNLLRRQFSLKTVLLLADKILRIVEMVHDKGIIHRDIKPDNFLTDHHNNIYIIDFGLSKTFWDTEKNEHIRFRTDKTLTGTPRYASLNNHNGCEQSRRDDLESLGYMLIYFMKPLPWQGIEQKRKYKHTLKSKEEALRNKTLFHDIPIQFQKYFSYVTKLDFYERPNYKLLRSWFHRLYSDCGFTATPPVFDWCQ